MSAVMQVCLSCRGALRLCSAQSSVVVYGRRAFLPKHVKPTLAVIAARKRRIKGVQQSRRSEYREWNYAAELSAFCARLGEHVPESEMRTVFTDRSHREEAAAESRRLGLLQLEEEAVADNSEWAVRGGRLVAALTAGWLRAALPRLPEQGVQAAAAQLSSPSRLAQLAAALGMTDLLLSQEYPPSEETLARCLEAFVAALDGTESPDRAALFVRDFVVARIAVTDISALWDIEEPLSVLAEVLERCGCAPPEPRLLRSAGPQSILAVHVVGIYSDRRLLASAPGETTEEATALAARGCLDQLMGIGEASPTPDLSSATVQMQPATPLSQWRPL